MQPCDAAPARAGGRYHWILAGLLAGTLAHADGLPVDQALWDGPACLTAANRGVDAIAEYRDSEGRIVHRAGSWLGRDGRYLLSRPDPGVSVRLVTTSGSPVQPGTVDIRPCPGAMPEPAVQALSAAIDARLRVYFGETIEAAFIEEQFELALIHLDQPDLLPWLATAHYELASFHRASDRLDQAATHYATGALQFDELGDEAAVAAALNAQGLTAWRQGDLELAVDHFHQSLARREAVHDFYGMASVANNLGLVHTRRREVAEALSWYELALSLFQGEIDLRSEHLSPVDTPASLALDLPAALNTLNNLALLLRNEGEFFQAERYWRTYLALEAHIPSPAEAARARLNLGRLVMHQARLDEALILLISALRQFEAAGWSRWTSETQAELSQLYLALGDTDSAYRYARLAASVELEDAAAAAEVSLQMARVHLFLDQTAEAEKGFGRAADRAVEAGSVVLSLLADGERTVIRTDMELQAKLLAQRDIRGQLLALGARGEAARIKTLTGQLLMDSGDVQGAIAALMVAADESRDAGDLLGEYRSLMLLGQVLAGSDPSAGNAVDLRGMALAEQLRKTPLPPLRRAELNAGLRQVYERRILGLVASKNLDEAWELAQRARHSEWVDDAEIRTQDTRRSRLLRQRSDWLTRLHRERLTMPRDANPSNRSSANLLRMQRELDLVETELARASTQTAEGLPQTITLRTVQESLATDELLLSYLALSDRTLLWIITADSLRVEELPASVTYQAELHDLSDRLRHPRTAVGLSEQLARQLGDILLMPAAAELSVSRVLLIQPDGDLHALPFGFLALTDDRTHQALLHSHIVRLVPGPIRPVTDQAAPNAPEKKALVMADPGWHGPAGTASLLPEQSLLVQWLRDERLTPLPGSRREAEMVSSRLSPQMPVRIRLGPEASRDFIVGGGLNGYGILHLATHGLVDLQFPALSSLLLADEAGAGPSFLLPTDIAGLAINARLVVLSGCETGQGRMFSGSAPFSLARPFMLAGAEQVLATLWKIDDHHTASFMDEFYQRYLEPDTSAAQALALAQREIERQPATRHPYFWAGFVLLSQSVGTTKDAGW